MMRSSAWGAIVLAWSVTAEAAPSARDRDRAAIAVVEQRLPARPAPGSAPPSGKLVERMAAARVPAVSIAYFEQGAIRWARAYGRVRAGTGGVATPDTRFQAASMSKAVTAAGALRLVEQGRLDLDGDVNARLRAWRVPEGGTVTLRQLLSHTAGLSLDGYPGYRVGMAVPTIVQSLKGEAPANTPAVRRIEAPGIKFSYSGGGYSVAQLLMTESAGSNFAALLERSVLRPAGMARSSFTPPPQRHTAAGHGATGEPVPGGSHIYPEQAAAGLWTTPSDYARFLIALQESWAGKPGALLTPDTARAMMSPVVGNAGLGVNVIRRGSRTAIVHGGANEGYRCQFVMFLDGAREGAVVMTNGENGGMLLGDILQAIEASYGWVPPPAGP